MHIMDTNWLAKLCITTTTTVVGYACYLILRNLIFKSKLHKAADHFNYLNIEIITTEEQCVEFLDKLQRKFLSHRAVGFDCEWVSEGKKRYPVALMQLSSNDGLCGLIRLNYLKKIPPSLKDFLEDESIYKVGVAPLDDAKYLFQDYGVHLKSTLDLRHIAQLCGYTPDGLASLAKQIFAVILDKDWRVRCSNWEYEHLTERQIQYAAMDAHIAIKMFTKIIMQLDNRGLNGFFTMKKKFGNHSVTVCMKYADVHFKVLRKNPISKEKQLKIKNNNSSNSIVESKRYPFATRSKPLYDNCYLQAPDGELLCTCDKKKALWYVEKGLADEVVPDPLTVRLRFEPAGRAGGVAGRYYRLDKMNECVVCGATDSYIRKNVVPREYRKYFPDIMKEHSSHDVVLLCVRCHTRSDVLGHVLRARLASLCRAPLPPAAAAAVVDRAPAPRYLEDPHIKKVKSAANALVHQSRKHTLPEERRRHLASIVAEHYGVDDVTDHLLHEATMLEYRQENSEYESHGAKVVEYFVREDGLLQLERLWREHFVETMRPTRLPDLWSLTHNEERLRERFEEGRLSLDDLKMLGLTHWLSEQKGI